MTAQQLAGMLREVAGSIPAETFFCLKNVKSFSDIERRIGAEMESYRRKRSPICLQPALLGKPGVSPMSGL